MIYIYYIYTINIIYIKYNILLYYIIILIII